MMWPAWSRITICRTGCVIYKRYVCKSIRAQVIWIALARIQFTLSPFVAMHNAIVFRLMYTFGWVICTESVAAIFNITDIDWLRSTYEAICSSTFSYSCWTAKGCNAMEYKIQIATVRLIIFTGMQYLFELTGCIFGIQGT